ncbi:CPBP family intramembrane glutamic endopeptidase [Enterobacteriaceae bacterium C23F]
MKGNTQIAMVLLVAFFSSALITILPLITLRYYSQDVSFLMMLTTEFILSLLVYFSFLRKTMSNSLMPKFSKKYASIFIYCFAILAALQIIAFILILKRGEAIQAHFSVVLTIIMTVIVPLHEEIFYRGCLFTGICLFFKGKYIIASACISSLIFCAMHFQYSDPFDFIVLFIASLLLIFIKLKTNGLFYPVILHSSMNMVFLSVNLQGIYR